MIKTTKLITAIITIFIIMPINGFLFTRYPAWFPFLLILSQIPMLVSILREWYDEPRIIYRDRVIEEEVINDDNQGINL